MLRLDPIYIAGTVPSCQPQSVWTNWISMLSWATKHYTLSAFKCILSKKSSFLKNGPSPASFSFIFEEELFLCHDKQSVSNLTVEHFQELAAFLHKFRSLFAFKIPIYVKYFYDFIVKRNYCIFFFDASWFGPYFKVWANLTWSNLLTLSWTSVIHPWGAAYWSRGAVQSLFCKSGF